MVDKGKVMDDLHMVIKSGEYKLVIEGDEQLVTFEVSQGIRLLEQHFVRLSEGETLEQWLRMLEQGDSVGLGIGSNSITLEENRRFFFSGYGVTPSQIQDAIKAALPPEKPRMIFEAEDGQRYEWVEGDFKVVA